MYKKTKTTDFDKPTVTNPFDPHLQQELVYNISISLPHPLAITPTPIKPTSTNQTIPFLTPLSLYKLKHLNTFSYLLTLLSQLLF